MLVARELLKTPRPELDRQASRLRESGIASRARIADYFADITVARDLTFMDQEHCIRGQCDALIFIPPSIEAERAGFYVVEIKTIRSLEYDRIKQENQPREDHLLQCLIHIWGIQRYYRVVSPRGGILYYENRDTLDYLLFDIAYDEARLAPVLDQLQRVLSEARQGRLPEHQEPVEHCSCCAYLEICPVGRQRQKEGGVPDFVLAKMIAERIVNKKKIQQSKRRAPRSLEELSSQLGWNEDRAAPE